MIQVNILKGFEEVDDKYFVTTCGKIIIVKNNIPKIMKPSINKKGYHQYVLCDKNDYKIKYRPYVHKLVAFAFLFNDDKANKIEVDHIDMNLNHNYVGNLEWVTPQENRIRRDSIKPSMAKLSKEDIYYIRSNYRKWREGRIWKSNSKELSKIFNVNEKTITNCANMKTYALF